MTESTAKLVDMVKEIMPSLIEIRRHLHAHPELSFQEFETANYIKDKLDEFGIENISIVETGLLGTIRGNNPESKSIVLRGDIDALPIQEDSGVEFMSKNTGVMHACGHDVHTTCIIGAGKILNEMRSSFEGTVYLLFQPGEEKLPGGASKILATGLIDKIAPEFFVGQHVYPDLEAGKVGFRSGMYMASADEIYINVNGPGGHAALPEKTVDVIYATSELIQTIKRTISSETPSEAPTVLTFGRIEGLGATNVIPKTVSLEGTFRTMNEEWRVKAHGLIKKIIEEVERSTGAQIDLDIRIGYPCLVNDSLTTEKVRQAAIDLLGAEKVVDLELRMTSEDFAFYTQVFPSCFYRLGTKSEGGEVKKLHSPEFEIDEAAIEIGTALMATTAIHLLND